MSKYCFGSWRCPRERVRMMKLKALVLLTFALHHPPFFIPSSLADHGSSEENNLARCVSVATGLNNIVKRPRVRTIFPHNAGNNNTLLGFEEGDVIALLIPDERDGWMYGELEKSAK